MELGESRIAALAKPTLIAVVVMLICSVGHGGDRPGESDDRFARITEAATPPPTPLLADDKILRA